MSVCDRRKFLKRGSMGSLGVLSGCNTDTRKIPSSEQPNIILCMADDHGWHETGYYDHPWLLTPTLDAMAASGLRFDAFYSCSPVCSPTRASVMTGRHSNRSGCLSWTYSLRPEEVTIAQLLRNAEYATAHIGKWHLGPVTAGSPTNPGAMGFDYWFSHDNFFGYNPPLSENGGAPEIYKGESSEILVEKAMTTIQSAVRQAKPFFTVLWFGSPHNPYAGSDWDLQPYYEMRQETKNYRLAHRYAEITAMDRALGQLRDFLRDNGLADNTVLWYCSDNGEPPEATAYSPLRGHKFQVYEGGIRVPAIIEWPSKIQNPFHTSVPCVTSDIFPTLCELLDIPLPDRPMDGISLMPLIEGRMQERPEPIEFWFYDHRGAEKSGWEHWIDPALQQGTTPTEKLLSIQFKNFRPTSPRTRNFGGIAAIRNNRYKLVEPSPEQFELYDIVDDITESRDLAKEHPDVLDALKQQLRQWQVSVERSLAGYDY